MSETAVTAHIEVKRKAGQTRKVKVLAVDRGGTTVLKATWTAQRTNDYAVYNVACDILEKWAQASGYVVEETSTNIELPTIHTAKKRTYSRN